MAKFKVGDKVKTRMPNGGWSDPVVIERIIEREGKKFYVCRTNNGTYPAHEWDIRLSNSRAANCGVRSTIPAVNAALGANAVKPGDMVKVEWEYDADKKGIVGMTGEVLKISSGIATVAIREKGNREYIVAGHALRKIANTVKNAVARNAKVKGIGPIQTEDDIVAVYDPKGNQVYKGEWDYCDLKDSDSTYDQSTKTYKILSPSFYKGYLLAKIG